MNRHSRRGFLAGAAAFAVSGLAARVQAAMGPNDKFDLLIKFLDMGFTLEQVVAMATVNPARVINRLPRLGTLQTGAPEDVSILEVVEGAVEFVDTRNNKRASKAHLRPAQAVLAGVPLGRPYQEPFSVR